MGVRLMLAVFAMVALAPAAAARLTGIIDLSVNETVGLSGSSVGCGSREANGAPYIYCTSSKPSAGYVALMAGTGRTEILSVQTHEAVFDRLRQAVGVSFVGAARVGDVIVVSGTSVLCQVITTDARPTVLCEYVNRRGAPRPNSYAFAISDAMVSSLEWDAKGRVHVLGSWRES
jgi:hypothetical protein